jgi:hypothetical protein
MLEGSQPALSRWGGRASLFDSPTDYCTVRVMGELLTVVLPEVPVTVTV